MNNPFEEIFIGALKQMSKEIQNLNRNNKIYMAGKLFSEADQNQRKLEYEKLSSANLAYNVEREIFSPFMADINDKSKLPTSLDIFNGDERELMTSDVIFADLADGDIGVAMELGMVIHKNVRVYAYLSDIRIKTAGEYEEIHVPYGYNQFVIGGIEKYFKKVYGSFDEALNAYLIDERENI